MTHFLLTTLCAFLLNTGTPTSPADTLNRYVIDNKPVENFDGSQLAGEKIVSYKILLSEKEGKIIRTHEIKTQRGAQPLWIVDGKVVSETDFQEIDASAIKSMSVYNANNVHAQIYEEYGDISGGVIIVELKAPGTYTPSGQKVKKIRIVGTGNDKNAEKK